MATSRMVEQACWEPTSGPAGSWAAQAGSLLAMSSQDVDADEEGRAARTVVRLAFGRHNCPRLADETAECGPEHDVAVADALTALRTLGLAENESASRRKKCVSCKATRLLTEFSADLRAPSGVHATCKQCRVKKDAERRAKRKAKQGSS